MEAPPCARFGLRLSLLLALAPLGACVNDRPALPPPSAAAPDPAVQARIARLEQAVIRDPKNGADWLVLAVLRGRAGDTAGAVDALGRLDKLGWDVPLPEWEFPAIRALSRYREIAASVAGREPHASTGAVAFKVQGAPFATEGIAYDPETRAFFMGDLPRRAILEVGRDGVAHELVHPGQDGLLAPLGIKVDRARRLLWVAANDEESGAGLVMAFDLASGAMRRKLKAPAEGKHLLNDLAIDTLGDVFVTDTRGGGLYRGAVGLDELVPYVPADAIHEPNGIALLADDSRLFVADLDDIVVVDVHTRATSRLPHDPSVSLGGIDGLTLAGRSLYAVQNGLGKPRVVRFELDAARARVESGTVLETENPSFGVPTTAAVAEDGLYVIANSQIDRLDAANKPNAGARIDNVSVLRIPL